MDERVSSNYQGATPPRRSLGAWLLEQANGFRAAIDALTRDTANDHAEIEKLNGLVDQLLSEAKRSAKVEAAQAAELEQVKQLAKQTQRQLSGLKISRGVHKAKAQKLLEDLENRLN
jgi:hypothetical protein